MLRPVLAVGPSLREHASVAGMCKATPFLVKYKVRRRAECFSKPQMLPKVGEEKREVCSVYVVAATGTVQTIRNGSSLLSRVDTNACSNVMAEQLQCSLEFKFVI
jgi:hypothetical protein